MKIIVIINCLISAVLICEYPVTSCVYVIESDSGDEETVDTGVMSQLTDLEAGAMKK